MNMVAYERIKAVVTILVTAVVNIANVYGYATDADAVVNVVLSILSALAIVYSWWKNQNVTTEAISAQAFLRHLKEERSEEE